MSTLSRIALAVFLVLGSLSAAEKPKPLSRNDKIEFYKLLASLRTAQAQLEAKKAQAIPFAVYVEQAQAAMVDFLDEKSGGIKGCEINGEDAEWTCKEPEPQEAEAGGDPQ